MYTSMKGPFWRKPLTREKGNTSPTDDTIRLLFDLTPHVRIAEHVPGKITMRFSLSGLGLLQNADFINIDQRIPGIRKTRTSLWRRAVVIEYDEDKVPFSIWEDLANCDHNPEQRKVLRKRLRKILEKSTSDKEGHGPA